MKENNPKKNDGHLNQSSLWHGWLTIKVGGVLSHGGTPNSSKSLDQFSIETYWKLLKHRNLWLGISHFKKPSIIGNPEPALNLRYLRQCWPNIRASGMIHVEPFLGWWTKATFGIGAGLPTYLRARGKGRKLALKVAQRRSLLGDVEGHVQREAEQCRLRQLSHTHWMIWLLMLLVSPGRDWTRDQTACEPARGRGTGEGS